MGEISQKQKQRISKVTHAFFGETNSLAEIELIKQNITEYPFFAYIIHDKDINDDGSAKKLHIHYAVQIRGRKSVKNFADSLGVDVQYVQSAVNFRSCIRYLIHKDDKGKFQYDIKDVVTNNADRLASYFVDNAKSVVSLNSDYLDLVSGRISSSDFIEKYRAELGSLNFYQQIRIIGDLNRVQH